MGYRRLFIKQESEKNTNPLKVTALQYDPEKGGAPQVVASGRRKVAEQILAQAHKYNIPIHEDPILAEALASVNLGEEIPPELYLVVAEVLAFVYRVKRNII